MRSVIVCVTDFDSRLTDTLTQMRGQDRLVWASSFERKVGSVIKFDSVVTSLSFVLLWVEFWQSVPRWMWTAGCYFEGSTKYYFLLMSLGSCVKLNMNWESFFSAFHHILSYSTCFVSCIWFCFYWFLWSLIGSVAAFCHHQCIWLEFFGGFECDWNVAFGISYMDKKIVIN